MELLVSADNWVTREYVLKTFLYYILQFYIIHRSALALLSLNYGSAKFQQNTLELKLFLGNSGLHPIFTSNFSNLNIFNVNI